MNPLGLPWILIENTIFFIILMWIVIFKKQSPNWVFTALGVYILYSSLRFMFSKQGMEFAVLWYTANAIGLMAIFYSFM